MFSIGGTELVIILLFAFLIFGPEKLPEIGRTVGRAIRTFRDARDEMDTLLREEFFDPAQDIKAVGKEALDALAQADTEDAGDMDPTADVPLVVDDGVPDAVAGRDARRKPESQGEHAAPTLDDAVPDGGGRASDGEEGQDATRPA